MPLKKYRKDIDKLDNELLQILVKRFKIVKNVARYKHKKSMKIFDKKREDSIVKGKIIKFSQKGIKDKRFVRKLYTLIMEKSRDIQKKEIRKLK